MEFILRMEMFIGIAAFYSLEVTENNLPKKEIHTRHTMAIVPIGKVATRLTENKQHLGQV